MHFSLYLPFLCNFCTVSPLPHYAQILRLPDHTNCTNFVLRSKRAHCACRTDLLCSAQNYGPAKCAGFGCAFVTFRNIQSVTDGVICYRLLLPKSLRLNGNCLFLLMFSNLARLSHVLRHARAFFAQDRGQVSQARMPKAPRLGLWTDPLSYRMGDAERPSAGVPIWCGVVLVVRTYGNQQSD